MTAFSLPAHLAGPVTPQVRRGVRPIDPPRSRASGYAPYRVLAIGGSLLAGADVLTHELALTGGIARALARRLGHGVDVTSCIDERGGVDAAVRAIRDEDLSKFDAVVLVLDEAPNREAAAESGRRAGRLVRAVAPRVQPPATLTVVVPPGSKQPTGQEASAFGGALEYESGAAGRVVRLADLVQVPSPAQRYEIWAETIAATVGTSMTAPMVWTQAVEEFDEGRRLTAVQRLGTHEERWEFEFRQLVTFARRAYGATCGSLSVIDGTRTRYIVRQGFATQAVAREQSICDLVLRTYGGVVVGDASSDDRFREFPQVTSGEFRFYAGYRVESPDGQPLGALCVFDREPRPVLSQDLALLRDFATSAERRLWQLEQRDTRR